jgi:transcriptional regulator with XRE-family HTH domain
MSQHKTLTKFDKGKLLREQRKRLGFTQKAMANKLNLDPTYLSLLENGHREVDDWYVQRAGELLADFEKSKEVQSEVSRGEREGNALGSATREECRNYFLRFLEMCDEPAKLGWLAVELREHFPLNKWVRKTERRVSSTPTSDEADAGSLADAAEARSRRK